MNFIKTTFALGLIVSSTFIFAQKYEPVVLEAKKGNENKSVSDKKEDVKYFIQFGIMSRNHDQFKNKYGVGVVYENCVITTYMSEKAKKNNHEVARYLTEKYGESWKKDLEIIPYGL
ncbi:hypothetical protein BA768_16845 [Chryseobacterium sp. CBo1]|uniref:FEKKY domain-containing protein n=1 Tax=Chryseobacterium sp. CBo1 TaxID=1869230 RepID=UPI000810987C|nr:hypothetical protein [Chryseobacterium sp. CBo1]OCK51337.1 hypothetical protein BA768_16845 [Chryseobacterium sp. CBo1]